MVKAKEYNIEARTSTNFTRAKLVDSEAELNLTMGFEYEDDTINSDDGGEETRHCLE
jgi:hypothetical protein